MLTEVKFAEWSRASMRINELAPDYVNDPPVETDTTLALTCSVKGEPVIKSVWDGANRKYYVDREFFGGD